MNDYVIITAANDSYIKTLINFIGTYKLDIEKLIIYDLGLNELNLNTLKRVNQKYNFILKSFVFDNYPEHVNLKLYNGLHCSYAFKPIILYNEANNTNNKNKLLIWMDTANHFDKLAIERICFSVKKNGFYSPISAYENTIESIELNHPTTVKYYGVSEYEHKFKLRSCSANLIGIDYNSKPGLEILNEWYEGSLIREVIMPEGSSRNNHRQDQTVLSLIMYNYQKNKNIYFDTENFGVSFWNKYDTSTTQENHIPYKLFNRNTGQQLAIIFCKNIEEANTIYINRKNIDRQSFDKEFVVGL